MVTTTAWGFECGAIGPYARQFMNEFLHEHKELSLPPVTVDVVEYLSTGYLVETDILKTTPSHVTFSLNCYRMYGTQSQAVIEWVLVHEICHIIQGKVPTLWEREVDIAANRCMVALMGVSWFYHATLELNQAFPGSAIKNIDVYLTELMFLNGQPFVPEVWLQPLTN